MDINNLKGLMEAYQQVHAPIDEAQKSFPFKKVEAQKEKARKGSVYGKPMKNEPAPKISDKEKSETGRFTKMQFAYDKAKRAKQEADKARRSSTFYKDTHPASAPKMKKANEELDIFDTVLEFLRAEGIAESLQQAEWMMANLFDKEEIDIIVEAMHEEEDEEDEKEMKKGKKSKKEEEDEDEEELDEALTGERYKKVIKKPGGMAYSRMVSANPSKRATRGGRGGESDFGAGDRGSGNKAARRAGTYQEEEFEIDEATYSAKAARAGKDIGKPGKAFAKIAKSAAKRYGSKERGEKVAGAILAKLRAKRG